MDRYAQIAFIVANLESSMRLAGKPSKMVSKEKMRFRERLGRLSDDELLQLVKIAEIDAKRRVSGANNH